jgi:hypothetical protein
MALYQTDGHSIPSTFHKSQYLECSNQWLVGGFNPFEKFRQWEGLSHILWKIKNV